MEISSFIKFSRAYWLEKYPVMHSLLPPPIIQRDGKKLLYLGVSRANRPGAMPVVWDPMVPDDTRFYKVPGHPDAHLLQHAILGDFGALFALGHALGNSLHDLNIC